MELIESLQQKTEEQEDGSSEIIAEMSSEDGRDVIQEKNPVESVDGDSDVNVANFETEAHIAVQTSRKRKCSVLSDVAEALNEEITSADA